MKTKGKRTSQADKLSDFERRLGEPMGLPYSPEQFEELKKAMRLRWQRGYDDAVAGRPMNLDESGRASPDYFGGYDAGEAERLSGKSESGKSESGKSESGKSEE